MKTILIAYVPVLHAGYLKVMEKLRSEAGTLLILGNGFLEEFGYANKEIRAVNPSVMTEVLRALGIIKKVGILDETTLGLINSEPRRIIVIKEQLLENFVTTHLKGFGHEIVFENAFLRWDEKSVYSQNPVDCQTSNNPLDREIMGDLLQEASKSSDWWRRVGAGITVHGNFIGPYHNQHLPTENTPYIAGDPRDFIEAGKDSHLCSAIHAEQAAIADAAKKGIALEGGTIYVTVFPCPVCAKLIAKSGIKRLNFAFGHASLDGQAVLEEHGVQIRRVPS